MRERQDWQAVTLNEVEWLYRSSFGGTRKITLLGDGNMEMEFTLPKEISSLTPLVAVLPPAKEWMWDTNGIPLNPMMLFEEQEDIDESQIMKRLPQGLRGAKVKYLFGIFKDGKMQIDPKKTDWATHVLLQVFFDFNQIGGLEPWDMEEILLQDDICWTASVDGECGDLERVCYYYQETGDKTGTRWYVYKMNADLEVVRRYCAENWKLKMDEGQAAFTKFLSEKTEYKSKMAELLANVSGVYSISMDGKGDGQFLELSTPRRGGGGSGGGFGYCTERRFFRYNQSGLEKLKKFCKETDH